MITFKKLSQRGDTIIEVLLAIVVMSAVLGGAYVTSNRSLNNARQAEERQEANKIVSSQIERMKALAPSNPAVVFNTSPYCLDPSLTSYSTAGPVPSSLSNDNFGEYARACQLNSRYYVAIIYSGDSADDFIVQVRWDRLAGGKDEIKVNYRLHK